MTANMSTSVRSGKSGNVDGSMLAWMRFCDLQFLLQVLELQVALHPFQDDPVVDAHALGPARSSGSAATSGMGIMDPQKDTLVDDQDAAGCLRHDVGGDGLAVDDGEFPRCIRPGRSLCSPWRPCHPGGSGRLPDSTR